MREPLLHTSIEDSLPDKHKWSGKVIYCEGLLCENKHTMLHCSNNECMGAWVETGRGNFCLDCFHDLMKKPFIYEEDFALLYEYEIIEKEIVGDKVHV